MALVESGEKNHKLEQKVPIGRRVTLVKSILEATPMYQHSMAYIPIGILEKIKKYVFNFYEREKRKRGASL
jgi:hypothetical protein